jgi:hypothetical protein
MKLTDIKTFVVRNPPPHNSVSGQRRPNSYLTQASLPSQLSANGGRR